MPYRDIYHFHLRFYGYYIRSFCHFLCNFRSFKFKTICFRLICFACFHYFVPNDENTHFFVEHSMILIYFLFLSLFLLVSVLHFIHDRIFSKINIFGFWVFMILQAQFCLCPQIGNPKDLNLSLSSRTIKPSVIKHFKAI